MPKPVNAVAAFGHAGVSHKPTIPLIKSIMPFQKNSVNGQIRHSDEAILMIEVFLKVSVSRHLSEIIHSS